MSQYAITQASPDDLAAIEAMLRMAKLPVEGLQATQHVWALREGSVVVGAVALEVHARHGLLRSLVVTPNHRGKDLGGRLLRHAVGVARALGLADVAALTTTIAPWLEREGWSRVGRAELPLPLQASAELRGACPDTAACFRLALA